MDDNERTILQFPPSSPGFIPSTLPFFVVGIGGSAGGIDALLRFFEAMPADNGMAFVIVLHLSPSYESNVVQILQTKSRMPVLQVNESVAIESNHVYVIPPSKDLLMNDGTLQVISAARPRGRHTAIDLFLRSLAEVHRERSVGIILSGSGSDGAVGIARIKEKGGITLAQSPEDAEYDSMPRSAIDTGAIDLSLPVTEMPQKLIALFRNASSLELPPIGDLEQKIGIRRAEAQVHESERALLDIMGITRERTGHDFSHYKYATVLRRIERRMQVNGLHDVMAYRKFLEQRPEETKALLQDMLISVTNFFRDHDAFDALEREVIPRIFESTPQDEQIRVWSLGCATGEEAYSLAMLLFDQNALANKPRSIQVFASDIDERAINIARHGLYPESIVADISPSRLRQYFDKEEQHYRVKREIREHMLFALHNVLRDPPFSKLNLISCRNLLIYLNRDIQKRVFEILHYALHPRGYLFLGSAESVDLASGFFIPVDKKQRIYQAANVRPGISHRIPALLAPGERLYPVKPSRNRSERRRAAPQDVHQRLLEEYAPPSVLIDEHNDVVYATRQAGRFLHYPGGETTNNILTTVHPDLQLELRAALFQASQSHQNVATRYIAMAEGKKTISVRVVICPAQDQHVATGMTLLVFEELNESVEPRVATVVPGNNVVERHLEEELKQTKEQLRTVIDQYEAALEDLKASNEELQAINEELRSTTEEMETSKEELQSTNEELITVNCELKMKVDETAKANDDLQNFISATEIAVIFIDRGMRIKRYTKPSTRIFNIIATDIDRSLLDITHRLDYPRIVPDIEQVFEKLQPVEHEVRSADGQWYIAKLLPYRTAEDRIDGVVLSFIDISGRKAVEQRLQESEQRMRLIAASTRDYAIATMDMDGIVTSWNNGAERLFGYSEKEILGQRAEVLYTPEDRSTDAFRDELNRARKDGRAEDDRWHVRKDGSRVFCSGITSPLIDEKICGFVKIARDLTRSKQIRDQQEARLAWEKQERVRAEEAARVRDEFFAVLSHELKQPLNLIQLTAEILTRLPETEKLPAVARGAKTIKRMVESQARIIDDLMDLSRLHTGKLTLACTQGNLNEAVSHVVNLMTSDAQQKNVELLVEQAPKELIVHGDMVRIEQVVWNLLSNALKFTPAGGKVTVRLRQDNSDACIEVADTGKGIPAEFLPFIFDMFRQANTGTTRQYGGLGIGLALVKQLVSSHGGRVEVDSGGVGQGSRFRVYLPLTLSKQLNSPPIAEGSRTLAGKRILLVDDATETLESLGNLLHMEGAKVTSASSGDQALKAAAGASEPYDLIISDIGMPGMDGYTLLAELRKVEATAKAPAIALSGFTRPTDVASALAAGFETHVRKPVVFDQFIATACRISG